MQFPVQSTCVERVILSLGVLLSVGHEVPTSGLLWGQGM